MRIVNFIKKNITMAIVLIAYIGLFIFKMDYGVTAVKNSGYYIKEMLMIMPVVFVLTALLDTWVPKETIIKYLGAESKAKGIIFAFILGSISAGPIYAAFPICVLLLKKGATIINIVIIISSWAVIKLPMLLNEVAFLGSKFMTIRWVLTVIAIVIFSYLTAMIVKKKDMPNMNYSESDSLSISEKACVGCGICKRMYPEVFDIKNKKAFIAVANIESLDSDKLLEVSNKCPMKAISYYEADKIVTV